MTTTEQDRKRTRSGDMATAGSRQNRIATRTDTEGGLLRQERTLTRKITGPPQDRTGLRHIRTVIRTVPLITTAQDHNRTGPARPGLRQKKATTGQVHTTGPQSFRTATGRDSMGSYSGRKGIGYPSVTFRVGHHQHPTRQSCCGPNQSFLHASEVMGLYRGSW